MRDVLAVSLDDRPRAFAVGRLARFHQRREVGHHPLGFGLDLGHRARPQVAPGAPIRTLALAPAPAARPYAPRLGHAQGHVEQLPDLLQAEAELAPDEDLLEALEVLVRVQPVARVRADELGRNSPISS